MSLQNFIKTVIAANIEKALQTVLVFPDVANRNYEGSLNNLGDKVRVIQVADPTITAYTRTSTITFEELDDAALELVADQAYSFAFKVHDVDAAIQKGTLLGDQNNKAAYGFAKKVDQYLAGLYTQCGLTSYATGTTNWDVNSANVEDVLMAVSEKADVADWPEPGRFMIVPPWFYYKLWLAGMTTKSVNDVLYSNGKVGMVLGWDIRKSNNVSIGTLATGADTRIICGIKGETFSYGSVVSEAEALRPEAGFDDAVKGLMFFGGKIMRPDQAMCIYCDKTSE